MMQILQRSPRRFNAKKPFELFSSPERLRFHFKSGATVKLLTLIFLFPRKELFSLILFLSLPLSLSLSLSLSAHFFRQHKNTLLPHFFVAAAAAFIRRWAENGDRIYGPFPDRIAVLES